MIPLLIAASIAEPAISQDARTYDTVRHPERFEGVRTERLMLPGENHRDTVVSLADDSDELFLAVLQMVARGRDDP